ncbi:MAG: DUF3592 domain-containing protein [Rhodothermales bacterium]
MPDRRSTELAIGIGSAAVFALIGTAVIAVGTSIYQQHSALKAGGLTTTGDIVRFERIGKQGGAEIQGTILVPVVRFVTASGQEVTFLGSTDTNPPWADRRAGGKITVIYDPLNPENARIDTFAEIWFAPLLLWAIGVAAILIPSLTIWRYVRTKNTASGSTHR